MDSDITIDVILSVFKSFSDKKKLKDIKGEVVNLLKPQDQLIWERQPEIEKVVDDLIKADKKLDRESYLTYSKGFYQKRKGRKLPVDGNDDLVLRTPTEYIGRAGECAVMSELMFRGYNANRMMIDEGIDIVAVKGNIYYYVQVKTVSIKDGRIYCQIGMERFDQYIGAQIRYIIVARYKDRNLMRNMFFIFTPREIDKYIHDRCIKRGESTISIKIGFNERSGEPYLYDEKQTDVSYHMNRFDL